MSHTKSDLTIRGKLDGFGRPATIYTPPEDLRDCPTCTGPSRETKGMVCQTCGTEYGPLAPGLDLAALRRINTSRCSRWHGPDTEPWTLADWSNAMCGEAGEAANVVKKVRRIDTGTDRAEGRFLSDSDERLRLLNALADELADVVIYADLVAANAGIDLSLAIVRKFNAISQREGFPEHLELVDRA